MGLLFGDKSFYRYANSVLSVQMRFSLYLYGNFNGSLLVAIEENGTTNAPLVWERNDQWTDDWEDVALQLTGLHHGCVKWKEKGRGDYVTLMCYSRRIRHGLLCTKVTSVIQLYPPLFPRWHSITDLFRALWYLDFNMNTLHWWWERGRKLLSSKDFFEDLSYFLQQAVFVHTLGLNSCFL